MEAITPVTEKSTINPLMGAVACILIIVVIMALVCYSVVTNDKISALETKLETPSKPICGIDTLSVCGTGTSVSGQIPIFKNDTSNLIGTSQISIDGVDQTNLTTGGSLSSSQININNEGSLILKDSANSNFLGLKAPTLLSASTTWTLPSADGTVGQLLQTDGVGALSFSGNLIDTATHIVDVGTGTKRLDFNMSGGTSGTGTTLTTSQTANRIFTLPDVDGLAVVERSTPADGRVIIGANNVNLRGRAKVQNTAFENSDVAPSTLYSLAQYRCNQFGDSSAAPGLGCFKSRSAITSVGANMGPVKLNDHILDITASGVTSGLASLGEPISGWISIQVSSVPVGAPGFGWIGTDYQLELVSKNGGQNAKRPVFRVSSEGIVQLRESISPKPVPAVNDQPVAGLATLPGIAINTVTVANTTLPADARILLTVQPGTAPAGQIYVSLITPNTSFDITSTNSADTCTVYYQIWQPITQV